MTYLAVTGATALWLSGKAGLLDALHTMLLSNPAQLVALRDHELVEGPVRLSASQDGLVTALWNVDYTQSTGDDAWGFISLDAEHGLALRPDISREVFERELYVISQRTQGLLIDGALIHRSWDDDTHTCLAGRGWDARHVNIGYVERNVPFGSTMIRAFVLNGPIYDFRELRDLLLRKAESLPSLLGVARQLYDPARKRNALDRTEFPDLRSILTGYFASPSGGDEFGNVSVAVAGTGFRDKDSYRTSGWTYWEWMTPDSPLSPIQRRVLESDAIRRHPIRIIGPAGSGKTLLMQLLTIRRLDIAKRLDQPARILYLVHNAKMAETVRHRFATLLASAEHQILDLDRHLEVKTLSEYGLQELGLTASQIIDPDAQQAKEFQFEILQRAINDAMTTYPRTVNESPLLREVKRNPALLPVLTALLMSEISTAIKGQGLNADERRYTESDRALSRLHGILSVEERRVFFAAFKQYHQAVFDGYGVLDSDDVAISLLGKLRTPIWELRRRELGFDHIFVDETQLFNENERRLLPLLVKSTNPHVPIVLALDEAQDVYGYSKAGLATLGIEGLASESLQSIHRSSRAIVRLAFFVIQRSTDLFGPDFPNFTGLAAGVPDDASELNEPPRIEAVPETQKEFPRFVLRRIRALRRSNLRRIAVICLAEQYWQPILNELKASDLPLHVLENRGERLGSTQPIVVVSRPAHIGGQEFDAALLVGAEQGVFPPRVLDNDALASAVEQQSLRELYISLTRARHRVVVALAKGATLTPVLEEAQKAGLIKTVKPDAG